MTESEALLVVMRQAQYAGVELRWKDWISFSDEERVAWIAVKLQGEMEREAPPKPRAHEYPLEGDTAKDLNSVLERAARQVS